MMDHLDQGINNWIHRTGEQLENAFKSCFRWLDELTARVRESDSKFNVLSAAGSSMKGAVSDMTRSVKSPSPSPSPGKAKSDPTPDNGPKIGGPDLGQSRPDVAAMVRGAGISSLAEIQGLDLGGRASVGELGMDGQVVGCAAQVSPVVRQQQSQSLSRHL